MEPVELKLTGRVDSTNALKVEQELFSACEGKEGAPVRVDCAKLQYISSAGLRVLLRLRKNCPDIALTGVSSDVYEILDMTGFTELMTVEKVYRTVSIEGCDVIGRGANGTIYRIDRDNVVKVYKNADALEDIRREREMAKLALILGIPTAISYDVVRVGSSYGSVFELLNASSFSELIAAQPDKFDWCVREYADMLRKIHDTVVPEGKLPEMKDTVLGWANTMQAYLPEWAGKKLLALVEAVPRSDHMLHGDYHTKNIELQKDEVLIIDMDTLSVGDPIFELGSMYNAFMGFSELDHKVIERFQGFDFETGCRFWRRSLAQYLGTNCKAKLTEVENKARVVGYTRLIRRAYRMGEHETEKGRAEIAHWTEELLELLKTTDTLTFSKNELEVDALKENLYDVLEFIDGFLESVDCLPKAKMQIDLAAEEIFVNIASYAYAPEKGKARIRVETSDAPLTVSITFVDHGVPYDPLRKEDPDLALPAEERGIGGLGILLTKKVMDEVAYEYRSGQNILTLKKNL